MCLVVDVGCGWDLGWGRELGHLHVACPCAQSVAASAGQNPYMVTQGSKVSVPRDPDRGYTPLMP